MPADKPKAHKPSKASGVPPKADEPEDAPAPAAPKKSTATKAAPTKATAETTPAMSTPGGKSGSAPAGKSGSTAGGKSTKKAAAEVTEPEPTAPDATTTDEEEAPPANPLEALRRAQANRVAPPGTQPRFGGSGTRGGNPSAPRHYNRHK